MKNISQTLQVHTILGVKKQWQFGIFIVADSFYKFTHEDLQILGPSWIQDKLFLRWHFWGLGSVRFRIRLGKPHSHITQLFSITPHRIYFVWTSQGGALKSLQKHPDLKRANFLARIDIEFQLSGTVINYGHIPYIIMNLNCICPT